MNKLKFSRAWLIIFFSVIFLGIFNPNIAEAGEEKKTYGSYGEAENTTELADNKRYNLKFPLAGSIISLSVICLGIFKSNHAEASGFKTFTSSVASKGEKSHIIYGEAHNSTK